MRYNDYAPPFSLEKCFQPKPPHGICTTAFKLHRGRRIGSKRPVVPRLGPRGHHATRRHAGRASPHLERVERVGQGQDAAAGHLPDRPVPGGLLKRTPADCPRDPRRFLAGFYGDDFMDNGVKQRHQLLGRRQEGRRAEREEEDSVKKTSLSSCNYLKSYMHHLTN